ncbi:hypothetical protein [Trinickia terrae]|nr:hypothetical protein [Trinickia terrae]
MRHPHAAPAALRATVSDGKNAILPSKLSPQLSDAYCAASAIEA